MGSKIAVPVRHSQPTAAAGCFYSARDKSQVAEGLTSPGISRLDYRVSALPEPQDPFTQPFACGLRPNAALL